jgi:hypothetical protein
LPEPLFLNHFGILSHGGKLDDSFQNPNFNLNNYHMSFRFYARDDTQIYDAYRPHRSLLTIISDTAGFFFALYLISYPFISMSVNKQWKEKLANIFGQKIDKTCCGTKESKR